MKRGCDCPLPNIAHESGCEWARRERELWAVAILRMELRLAEIRAGIVIDCVEL